MLRLIIIALIVGLTGCVPLLSPPIHGKLGAAYTSKAIRETEMSADTTTTGVTHWPSYVAAGVDTANVSELPGTVGAGVMGGFGNWGNYVELGAIQRVLPHLRIGVNGGAEYWIDGDGPGVRGGVTVEYTGHHLSYATSEYNRGNDGTHDQSTTYSAAKGSFAVGAFIDVGHRWLRDEPNNTYIAMGLSVRLAAIAGIVDLTGVH